MERDDLARVLAIADKCHPDHPEDEAVFQERLALYPGGCRVLQQDGQVVGYIICHPGLFGEPVALNTMLTAIAENADVLYIHDISIDLGVRGQGAASEAVEHVKKLADKFGFQRLALAAVNRSHPFWHRHGFEQVTDEDIDRELSDYGDASSYMICELA